jgi:hypothetical protein
MNVMVYSAGSHDCDPCLLGMIWVNMPHSAENVERVEEMLKSGEKITELHEAISRLSSLQASYVPYTSVYV